MAYIVYIASGKVQEYKSYNNEYTILNYVGEDVKCHVTYI